MPSSEDLLNAAIAGYKNLSHLYSARSLEVLAYDAGATLARRNLTTPASCVANGNSLRLFTETARYNVAFGPNDEPFIVFDRPIF